MNVEEVSSVGRRNHFDTDSQGCRQIAFALRVPSICLYTLLRTSLYIIEIFVKLQWHAHPVVYGPVR